MDTMEEVPSLLDQAPPAPAGHNVPVDYFGFTATKTVMLPDKVSWVEVKVLNEGERRRMLNEQNRELNLGGRGGRGAQLRMRPGDDKALLLKTAIVGWNLTRNGQPVPFNPAMLDQFLNNADPKLIDLIEREVKRLNPWTLAEMSLEDIRREIADLQEMERAKMEEEEGN